MKMKIRNLVAVILSVLLVVNMTSAVKAANGGNIDSDADSKIVSELKLKSYYYNELNDIEKAIYENLADSKDELLEGKEVTFAIHPYNEEKKLGYVYYYRLVRRAIMAYIYDNPEAELWLDNYERVYLRTKDYTYMVLKPMKKTKGSVSWEENTREAMSELEEVAIEFVKTLHGTDKEKLKQIHDWLASRAIYDNTLELPNTRTAYGTMINKKSVCSGFAYAYKYIANIANLDVIYVTGKVYDEESDTFNPHAWNVVCIEGEYYIVDVTFDIPTKNEPSTTFLFSKIKDNMHYPEKYYFDYPF